MERGTEWRNPHFYWLCNRSIMNMMSMKWREVKIQLGTHKVGGTRFQIQTILISLNGSKGGFGFPRQKKYKNNVFYFSSVFIIYFVLNGRPKVIECFKVILGNPRSSSSLEESQKHKMVLHAMWNAPHGSRKNKNLLSFSSFLNKSSPHHYLFKYHKKL